MDRGYCLMLQGGLAGQKQTVIQHDGAVPVGHIDEQDVLISRFQHQGTTPCILGFDGGLAGDAAPQRLAEEIAHTLQPVVALTSPTIHCMAPACVVILDLDRSQIT